ncbi:DUF4113 domain-containing protein [Metapseudomonas otitidis]|uniref:DUF4113 domain-containing protein n=1 Tax=Metapseudomonas otitidis TaxID=319939 RepID=UPI0013F628E0|nr:DUF4113 domain-containing protein [Pseudomonas otitidis]
MRRSAEVAFVGSSCELSYSLRTSQAGLSAQPPAAQRATLDRINQRMGIGTVRLAAVPYEAGWAMKQAPRSPCFLSR